MKALITSLEAVFNEVNRSGNEIEIKQGVADFFTRQHRTLQQSFMKLVILPILRKLAANYGLGIYDDRNAASCKLAARMLEYIPDEDLYLPYI